MISKILIGLVLIVAVLIGVVAIQPSTFSVSRSATLPASPAVVFDHVNDLHKWEAWSPWAKLDPNSKSTFAGPVAGVGSSMAWAGNKEVGEGKMTITASQPNEKIAMRLEFLKPFEATSTTEFTFTPDGEGTKMTWTMTGENGFIGKAMHLVIDCDKMLGDQFNDGLENLKKVVGAGQN